MPAGEIQVLYASSINTSIYAYLYLCILVFMHMGTQWWLCLQQKVLKAYFLGVNLHPEERNSSSHGSHGSLGKLSSRWSMQLQSQYHRSINSAACAAYIPNVLLWNLLWESIWAMEISCWTSASGWILENSQQIRMIFFLLSIKNSTKQTKTTKNQQNKN